MRSSSAMLFFISANSSALIRRPAVWPIATCVRRQGYAGSGRHLFCVPPPSGCRSDFGGQRLEARRFSRTSSVAIRTTMKVDYPPVLVAPRRGALEIAGGPTLDGFVGQLLVIGVWGSPASADKKENGKDGKDGDPSEAPTYVLPPDVAAFDSKLLAGALAEAALDAEFAAKAGSSTDVLRVAGAQAKRVVLYGLGDPTADSAGSTVANAAAFAVEKGTAIKGCKSVGLFVQDLTTDLVARVAEGAHVGAYVDERYKEKKTEAEKVPTSLVLLGAEAAGVKDIAAAAEPGIALAAGIITTKEVVASPANFLHPTTMGIAARQVAQDEGLECKILGRDELQKLGMGALLAVAQGAGIEPQFIHLTYKPAGEVRKRIAIVGKTVCHDTGGYNLKAGPGSMIELMKWDMGGGGTTLGAARAIGMLKPRGVEVHFIMPAVLNMISDHAILPGDIVTAGNGKTIEIVNTDAEGRLCLVDALIYAEKHISDLDAVIDIATLTGACIVALGNDYAGLWSSSDALSDALLAASKGTPDKFWRMPLPDEYVELLKSKIADLRNIGTSRGGGAITAALFIREFVKTKEWAHLDIAGTAWSDKKSGATGFGVRTCVNWINSLSH